MSFREYITGVKNKDSWRPPETKGSSGNVVIKGGNDKHVLMLTKNNNEYKLWIDKDLIEIIKGKPKAMKAFYDLQNQMDGETK